MGFIAFYLITLPPGTAAKGRTQHLRWQGQTQAEKAAAIKTVKRARVLAMMTSAMLALIENCRIENFGGM